MFKKVHLVAVLIVLTMAGRGKCGEPLVIESWDQASIVTAADTTEPEQFAAEELREYLRKATGVDLPIVKEPGQGVNIYIGQTGFAREALPSVDWEALGTDGIVLESSAQQIILAGGRPRGTIYAVYEFLEHLGFRFWTSEFETVPTLDQVELDLSRVYVPPFVFRQYYSQGAVDWQFAVKMRLTGREWSSPIPPARGGMMTMGGAHTLTSRFLNSDVYFEEHPEWYAWRERENKRVPDQLCMTNRNVHEQVAREVLTFLEAAGTDRPRVVSVSCADNANMCQCDECAAVVREQGSYMGPLLLLVNYVADRVAERYPDVLISTLAYWKTDKPPRTIRPARNVLILLGVLDRNHKLPINKVADFSQYVAQYGRQAEHFWIWDYDAHFSNFLQPHPNYFVLPESLRYYRSQGVKGVFVQGPWGAGGEMVAMRTYVNSRLLWNPSLDARTVMKEFLEAYYGAAGEHVWAYLQTMHRAVWRNPSSFLSAYGSKTPWLNLTALNRATQHIEQAFSSVPADSEYADRLKFIKLSLDVAWLQSYDEMRSEAVKQSMPFLGPDDPYVAVKRLERNELQIGTYRENGAYELLIERLRELFPERSDDRPTEVDGLSSWRWREVQQNHLKVANGQYSIVDDARASDGRALSATGDRADFKVFFMMPPEWSGVWHAYIDLRVEPGATEREVVVPIKVYQRGKYAKTAVVELARVETEWHAQGEGYRRVYLGQYELLPGSEILLEPRGTGAFGDVEAVVIDRIFLASSRDASGADAPR